MGVYIKGMSMPKNCGECPCYYYEYKECNAIGGRMVFRNATPPTDCPLVELPPHGRLIDADVLTTVTEMVNGEFKTYIEVFEVLDAPTIIESEE